MAIQGAMAAIGIAQNSAAAIAAFRAAQNEARALDEQALIMDIEGRKAANMAKLENRKFEAKQKLAFLSNGIDLSGSPLLVLEETEEIGREEVNALKRSVAAKVALTRGKAHRVLEGGRAAFFEASAKSASSAAGALGGTKTKSTKAAKGAVFGAAGTASSATVGGTPSTGAAGGAVSKAVSVAKGG